MEYIFKIFSDLIIPEAVYNEVVLRGIQKGESDAIYIQNAIKTGKIRRLSTGKEDPTLKNTLHDGERETLQLAEENSAIAIIDERKARLIAKQRKIEVHGTLGILFILLREKQIDKDQYARNLEKFAVRGRISIDLFERYRKLGENNE